MQSLTIAQTIRVVLENQAYLYALLMSFKQEIITGRTTTGEQFDQWRLDWATETAHEFETLGANSGTENS